MSLQYIKIHGWMSELEFYLLNGVSVILGRWAGDNGWQLRANEPRLLLKISLPQSGLEPGTTRSVRQHLICCINRDFAIC